jgi:predicted amino acid dehydrogenase
LLDSLTALGADDLTSTVSIRGEPVSVATAVVRGLDHAAGHVGQIVMLAKHWRGDTWQTLSMPRRRRA